ncbi:monocarboxylate transporter 13-like [Ptychodera flava]|uniref:monocarboxylate transporter 13-like n=1 Tax=Ptychodera flava TaxID=63121 RepID=UPI003969BDE4
MSDNESGRSDRVNDDDDDDDDSNRGWYGWLVVLASHFCCWFVFGLYQSIGPLFVAVQQHFEASSVRTSWILSTMSCFQLGLGPIVNIPVKRFGHRPTVMMGAVLSSLGFVLSSFAPSIEFLYLSMGVFVGFGYCLITSPALGIVALYVKRRYVLANALTMSGCGLGTFVLTPLWDALIDGFGWSGALILFSSINAQLCVCAALYRPKTKAKTKIGTMVTDPDANSNSSGRHGNTESNSPPNKKMLCGICDLSFLSRNPVFLVYACAVFLGSGMACVAMAAFMFLRAESKELSSSQDLSFLISIYGCFDMLGRLLPVPIFHFIPALTSVRLYGLALFFTGVISFLSVFANSFAVYGVVTSILGVIIGFTFTLLSQVVKDLFGSSLVTTGITITTPFLAVGAILGPTFAGLIYDLTGNYDNTFYYFGACLVTAGSFLVITESYFNKRRRKSRQSDEPRHSEEEVEMVSYGEITDSDTLQNEHVKLA